MGIAALVLATQTRPAQAEPPCYGLPNSAVKNVCYTALSAGSLFAEKESEKQIRQIVDWAQSDALDYDYTEKDHKLDVACYIAERGSRDF